MAHIIHPHHILFGMLKPKPPQGFPPGRLRWRIRHDDFVFARVRTADGIREFTVKQENDHWLPDHEISRNQSSSN